MLFQMSGEPGDLANFVDYDYRLANIWVQMKRGDNREMTRVERVVGDYTRRHPLPSGVTVRWSGLTYINMVWQHLMVIGMRNSVLGGALVVFVLMIILFRSIVIGFVSMLPLSFAIVLSYGLVGLVGRDYDMPIAVCSSLAIGLAVDFAIHFLQRYRAQLSVNPDRVAANDYMFSEPGRAITRNALVVILGFLPLLISNLTPYKTVGLFFALLMTISVIVTLAMLPGIAWYMGHRQARSNNGQGPPSDKEPEGVER